MALNILIQQLIEAWPPSYDLPFGDPLFVQVTSAPMYLPLLQPKTPYSHRGRRERSMRVLGLDVVGNWVEDNSSKGKVSWVYGSDAQCFGTAPFALSPLLRARKLYPDVAELIWNESHVSQIEGHYLQKWERLTTELTQRESIDPLWFLHSGLVGTARALGHLETSATLGVLLSALTATSSLVRREAVQGLWATTPGQGLDVALFPLVADPDMSVREAVARALGYLGDMSSLEILLSFLSDDPPVQTEAIDALVALGYREARPLILQLAFPPRNAGRASTDERVRMTAILALQTFWQAADADVLISALTDIAIPVRTASAYVLGQTHVTEAVKGLEKLLTDDAPAVRVAAIYALLELNAASDVIPNLVQIATSGRETEYIDPIEEHGHQEGADVIHVLRHLARNGNKSAADALRGLGVSV